VNCPASASSGVEKKKGLPAEAGNPLFYDTRTRLLAELDDIPIACQAYRLRVLERVAAKAESMGNLPLAARIIEQAAREVGSICE